MFANIQEKYVNTYVIRFAFIRITFTRGAIKCMQNKFDLKSAALQTVFLLRWNIRELVIGHFFKTGIICS